MGASRNIVNAPSQKFQAVIKLLCAEKRMTQAEAVEYFHHLNGGPQEAMKRRAEQQLAQERRKVMGQPEYRPRDDYVRGAR